MQQQAAKGFIDLEIGDYIEISPRVKGPIYDIRFCQEIRSNISYFELRLEGGPWVPANDVKVIERKLN